MGNFNVSVGSLNNNTVKTIPINTTKTAAIPTQGLGLCGIKFPSAMTGTGISFEMCETVDGTFVAMNKADGNPLTYVTAASKYTIINPDDFQGVAFIKIVSNATELAARTLICSFKGKQ